jgi:hypothetical protein
MRSPPDVATRNPRLNTGAQAREVDDPGPRPQRAWCFLVQAGMRLGPGLRVGVAAGGERLAHLRGARHQYQVPQPGAGHRVLKVLRKPGKHAEVPLTPRTARALDFLHWRANIGPIRDAGFRMVGECAGESNEMSIMPRSSIDGRRAGWALCHARVAVGHKGGRGSFSAQ